MANFFDRYTDKNNKDVYDINEADKMWGIGMANRNAPIDIPITGVNVNNVSKAPRVGGIPTDSSELVKSAIKEATSVRDKYAGMFMPENRYATMGSIGNVVTASPFGPPTIYSTAMGRNLPLSNVRQIDGLNEQYGIYTPPEGGTPVVFGYGSGKYGEGKMPYKPDMGAFPSIKLDLPGTMMDNRGFEMPEQLQSLLKTITDRYSNVKSGITGQPTRDSGEILKSVADIHKQWNDMSQKYAIDRYNAVAGAWNNAATAYINKMNAESSMFNNETQRVYHMALIDALNKPGEQFKVVVPKLDKDGKQIGTENKWVYYSSKPEINEKGEIVRGGFKFMDSFTPAVDYDKQMRTLLDGIKEAREAGDTERAKKLMDDFDAANEARKREAGQQVGMTIEEAIAKVRAAKK